MNHGFLWGIGAAVVVAALAGFYCCRVFLPHRERAGRGKRLILCIGDSITFGSGVIPTRARHAWPYVLSRLLGKNYQALNYGIPGATMQAASDHPYSRDFIKAFAGVQAELCLLMLGTNDSKPHNWNRAAYKRALAEWLDRLAKLPGKPKIILMAPPKAFSVHGKPIVYDICDSTIRDEIVPMLRREASRRGLMFVDLYAVTEAHPYWFSDGVHPNRTGNRQIAEMLCARIKPVLSGRR